ncbi:hypothetical protein QR680_002618 [Steinernema hermaphroditum]|uniref:Tetraspanin n=1 Tax=Steinernema hermaphroditum TaxID=289476 RepID=A0AA39H3D4_9BILA|nr:hypothetical protein QR680_002618 [Steinernema hermaphroditum]
MFFSPVVFRCIRYGALTVNVLLATVAIALFAVTVSTTFWPPKPTVTVEPINKHHQFVSAILCLCAFSLFILCLAVFGVISILVRSSFCLLTYLTGLLVLISIQVLAAVFSVASKPHLHDKFVQDWKLNVTDCARMHDASLTDGCRAWYKLLDSEGLLFASQVMLLCLELFSMVLCGIVCERVTRMEQAKIMEEEDD